MTQIDRRGLLTAAAVSIAAAGMAAYSSAQGPVLRESAGTEAASTTAVPASGAPDWKGLASRIAGKLALPGARAYNQVKLLENPRFDTSQPLAVLQPLHRMTFRLQSVLLPTPECQSRFALGATASPAIRPGMLQRRDSRPHWSSTCGTCRT
jgi:hypothetical protein